jgi:hypothetical protein
MKTTTTLLSFCITLCFAIVSINGNAQTAAPTCATINYNIPIGGCTCYQNMTDFTIEGTSPAISCISGGIFRREGWYSFTSPGGIAITVSATSVTAASNLVIQVISGTCANETEIGCANNITANGAQTESVSLGVLAVGTYFIRIVNVGNAANMTVSNICVNAVNAIPCNDECSNPVNLLTGAPCGGCYPIGGSLSGATSSGYPATCGGTPSDDVWYSFTAAFTTHIITVTPCAGLNPVIQVYADSCGTGNTIGCMNANGVGVAETLTLTALTVGNTYWVRVYDFTGSPTCETFTICIQTPLINDDCVNAISLTPNATCIPTAGCVYNATDSGVPVSPTCSTSNPDDDVWYVFQATGTCNTITVTPGGTFDPSFEVFNGGSGVSPVCLGSSILCNAPGGNPGTISSAVTTTPGNWYYVRVYDYNVGNTVSNGFTICILSSCSSVGITKTISNESTITISPNPFTSQTTITFSEEQKNITIKVMDVMGQCVLAPPPFLQGGG